MSTDRSKRMLRNLQTTQRRIFGSFKLIKEFVEGFKDDQIAEVPVRLEAVIELWREFGKVQAELETLDEATDALETHLKERSQFETAYYFVKGFLIQHCQTPVDMSISAIPTHTQDMVSHLKLPDIELPKFKGDYTEWLNFHDLFTSLVHCSTQLSSIQKFHYLRSSLRGEALGRVAHLDLNATNYPVAWNLLVEHYQQPRELKRKYVQSLFDFPILKHESADDLHALVEKFEANVRVLKQLGEHTEYWDIFLVHCLANLLDPVTRRGWEDYSATNDAIQFSDITSFIQRRVGVLHASKQNEPQQLLQNRRQILPRLGSHGAFQENRNRKCVVCSEDHFIYRCPQFAGLSHEEKENLVRNQQLCRNCLRKGHYINKCWSESSCRTCGLRHHTQLCTASITPPESSRSTQSRGSAHSSCNEQHPATLVPALTNQQQSYSGVSSCNTQCVLPDFSKVVLATAVVIIVDEAGREYQARALLDSGSECCFASNNLVNKMKITPTRVDLPITGVGRSSTQAKLKFRSVIKLRTSDYTTSLEFLILPELTIDLPSINLDIATWKIPEHLLLSDPSFNKSCPIDLVLGAELFFDLFPVAGHRSLGNSLPTLTKSVFGWIVSGKAVCRRQTNSALCNVAAVCDTHELTGPDLNVAEPTTNFGIPREHTRPEKLFDAEFSKPIRRLGFQRKKKKIGVSSNVSQRIRRSEKKSTKNNTGERCTKRINTTLKSNVGRLCEVAKNSVQTILLILCLALFVWKQNTVAAFKNNTFGFDFHPTWWSTGEHSKQLHTSNKITWPVDNFTGDTI